MRLDFSFIPKDKEDHRVDIAGIAMMSGITHLYVENSSKTMVYSKAPKKEYLKLFKGRVVRKFGKKRILSRV